MGAQMGISEDIVYRSALTQSVEWTGARAALVIADPNSNFNAIVWANGGC